MNILIMLDFQNSSQPELTVWAEQGNIDHDDEIYAIESYGIDDGPPHEFEPYEIDDNHPNCYVYNLQELVDETGSYKPQEKFPTILFNNIKNTIQNREKKELTKQLGDAVRILKDLQDQEETQSQMIHELTSRINNFEHPSE